MCWLCFTTDLQTLHYTCSDAPRVNNNSHVSFRVSTFIRLHFSAACVSPTSIMGEARQVPDNTSTSSTDSIKLPTRIDISRLKPGPGALPADEFDPLKHEEWEQFWYIIDQHFQPVNQDDELFLRSIPVNPFSGLRDRDLRLPFARDDSRNDLKLDRRKEKREPKREKQHFTSPKLDRSLKMKTECVNPNFKPTSTANSSVYTPTSSSDSDSMALCTSLNSFPFTHRLVAAMLDDSSSGASPAVTLPVRGNRANNSMDDCLWMGIGGETDVRSYQTALEERVKIELIETGLLEEKKDDPLQTSIRHEQWKLRDTKTMNRMRKTALVTRIVGTELRQQAIIRELKKYHDQIEMAYLERMVRNMKKNKKSRTKFQKILQRMFGHYKDRDKTADKSKKVAETASNGRLITHGDDKPRSTIKKKKKKTEHVPSGGAVSNGGPSRM